MNWKELSDTTKALIYLAGVVASAFVGGAIAIGTLRPILDAPEQISDIKITLEEKIAELKLNIDTIDRQNEKLENLSEKNLDKISSLEEVLELTSQPFSGTFQSLILNRHADQLESLPDLSLFALRSQIPNLSGYARTNQLPDMSQYAKHTDIPLPPDLRSYLRSGDRITAQGVSGKYLFDLDSRNRDELDVVMSSAQEWRIRKSN